MKTTIVKAIAFTAIMISGLQAQAALTACSVTKETEKGNYSEVLFLQVGELPTDATPQIFSDEKGDFSVDGYNFMVTNNSGNLSLTAYKMVINEDTQIAGAAYAAMGAKNLTLIVPQLKVAVSCTVHVK